MIVYGHILVLEFFASISNKVMSMSLSVPNHAVAGQAPRGS